MQHLTTVCLSDSDAESFAAAIRVRLPPGFQYVLMIKYAAIISGVFALVGFLTNVSLVVFVYTNLVIITHFYSYSDFHHTEAPLMLALVYLALSPAGRVLSVDRLLRGRSSGEGMLEETSPYARWPILLAQWTFALVYLSAFMEKLVFVGGLDWLNGYTLQYAVANDTLRRGTLMGNGCSSIGGRCYWGST